MDNWNIRQEGSTLYISLEYELTVFNSPALQDELEKWLSSDIREIVFPPQVVFKNCAKEIREIFDIAGVSNFVSYVDDMSSAQEPDLSEDEDDEWQQKMAEAKQKMLEHFSAHNDVVVYQMKLGQNE